MSRTRIVAVDDDRRILRILKHACECVGFKVHSVQDANFFESAFRTFEPALVFLDLNMRTIDGVEILRFIADERPGTSVIVTSGVDRRLLNAARGLGTSLGLDMLEPIAKPLMIADIRQRLKQFDKQPAPSLPAPYRDREPDRNMSDYTVDINYQPMVNLQSGQVVCAEAQACIRHPRDGLVKADQFIRAAQHRGLLKPLTFTVIRRALWDLSHWNAAPTDLQVAVHLSQDLLLDAGFTKRVDDRLRASGIQPQRLMLEIVECAEISDRGKLATTLAQLSELGVALALNNFGSSISSLSHLYEFPYQTLKLDKQFALQALNDENAAAMIRSSLGLASSVGLTVAVEGIQSEDTLRWLGNLGCELGQGMCISPPMPSKRINSWLATLGQQDASHAFHIPAPDAAVHRAWGHQECAAAK